jgi:hypothetical protein
LRASEPGAPFGQRAMGVGCADSTGGVDGIAGPFGTVLAGLTGTTFGAGQVAAAAQS